IVELVRSWGFTATCCVNGARHWQLHYNTCFAGADVLVLLNSGPWRDSINISLVRVTRGLRVRDWPEQPPSNAEEFAQLIKTAQKYVDPLSPEAFGLKLSPPKTVKIDDSLRMVRSGPPTPTFEAAWQANPRKLKAAGYSFKEFRGRLQVSFWQDPPEG